MLVLSRKMMESLYLLFDDGKGGKHKIKVQVVGTGRLTRLGIEADPDVVILREELMNKEAKEEAQQPAEAVVATT